jgi:hypothetical protein
MDGSIDANGDRDRESVLVEARNGKPEIRETLPAPDAEQALGLEGESLHDPVHVTP